MASVCIRAVGLSLYYCTNEDVHSTRDMIDGAASEPVNDSCQPLQNRPCTDPLNKVSVREKGSGRGAAAGAESELAPQLDAGVRKQIVLA
jgi:hypothetical protein